MYKFKNTEAGTPKITRKGNHFIYYHKRFFMLRQSYKTDGIRLSALTSLPKDALYYRISLFKPLPLTQTGYLCRA